MVASEYAGRQLRQARKKGKSAVMIAYFSAIVVAAAICTWRVSTQAVERLHGDYSDEPINCVDGIRSLELAVNRARRLSSDTNADESASVAMYRSYLNPEWKRRGDIERACSGDPGRMEALDAVVHLGFAEEHAVRRDAVELGAVRRKAASMIQKHIPLVAPAPALDEGIR